MSIIDKFIKKEIKANRISSSIFDDITKRRVVKFFLKGHKIVQAGSVTHEGYLVSKGCIRQYQISGFQEKTTAFFTEGQLILPNATLSAPYQFNLVALEDCELIVCCSLNENALFDAYPQLERICRQSLQIELIKLQNEFATFITSSPEERYLNLLKENPNLFNRVPLKYIASFLGMTPESLSRIRRRIINRDKEGLKTKLNLNFIR